MEITKLNLELQEKLIVLLIYCIFIVLANSTSHGRISRSHQPALLPQNGVLSLCLQNLPVSDKALRLLQMQYISSAVV